MKYHIIYKTTNLINGKWYIGKHSTDNLDDGYIGSGRHFKLAVRKYGKQNFKREIICFCNSEQEAYDKEAELVTMEVVKNPMSYNKMPGGEGSQKRYSDEELKEHVREYKREYQQANKERIREYQRANKEYQRKWCKDNKERLCEYQQEYRQANKEYYREYKREWYQANKESIREKRREYKREYYQANKERELEYKLVKMVKLARQKYLSK